MKKIAQMIGLLVLAAPLHAAQLYRWVDSQGRVEWRDTPPPPTATNVERRTVSVSTISTSEPPYSLQQAMKKFPVTLWATGDCGDPCARARGYLKHRGVPYTEKNPQSDVEGFKKASGGNMELPLLLVGSSALRGYLESSWDTALDAAGYPKTPVTPPKP